MKYSLLFFLGILFGTAVIQAQPDSKHPNILLIMCDDLGWGDVGFNGNTIIQTPNLDRLSQQGMIFSRWYAAAPVCSPTRASSITGRNPNRMGIPTANSGHMKEEEITLPELLKKAGYTTGHFGKWHLGTLTRMMRDANRGNPRDSSHYSIPTQHGYDQYFCTESKVPTYDPMIKPKEFDTERGESLRYGWRAIEGNSRGLENYGTYYWDDPESLVLDHLEGDNSKIIMDRVIPFAESAISAGKPFFSTVWFHTPHLPVVASQRYRDMYPDKTLKEQLLFGTITAMDEQVGRLWDKLESLGVADNTMLWFCSDNGPERGTPGLSGPFRERKRSLYEGGVRVPGFVIWPNQIQGGSTTDFPGVTSDYLPTILQLLDIDYPDPNRPVDGISLHQVFAGKAIKRKKAIGFQHRTGARSWVSHQYKLIKPSKDKSYELYDLLADKEEQNNVAADHPKVVAKMQKALEAWEEACKRSTEGADYF